MAVWYLDNDDEITDAVARLRDTSGEHVVFVVPPGSRIATGRINFKLLAREAEGRDLRLAIASPDEQVRALATSAGVLSNATPDGAEAALERGDEPPQPTRELVPADSTVAATDGATTSAAGRSFGRGRLTAATLIVLGVVIVGGYVAAPSVSTADIEVTPATAPLGPLLVPVLASADVEAVDAEAGRIPAVTLSIPLRVSDTFEASIETVETRAVGEVIFSSVDPASDAEIPEGTIVRTPSGVEFRTINRVALEPSTDGTPFGVAAAVEAVDAEPVDVAAAEISLVPTDLGDLGITVRNPESIAGGSTDELPTATVSDYAAARADLSNRLEAELRAYLSDPRDLPEGHLLFPDTVQQGSLRLDPPDSAVIGRVDPTFELSAEIEVTATAVDPDLVNEVVASQLDAAVQADQQVFPGSVTIALSEGVADGEDVAFEGTAEAVVYPVVDGAALAAEIAGLPIPEAQAILEAVGQSTVNVWPGFVTDVPSEPDRIRLEVREPSTPE